MKILGTFFLNYFCIILFLITSNAIADTNTPLDLVLKLAQEKKISETRPWKKLLHLEPNALGFETTQISDANFYLAHSSELKNHTEIEATLISFIDPAEKFAKEITSPLKKNSYQKITDHSQHAICRFPARLTFLKNQLPEAKEYWNSLPSVNCVFQKIYLEALAPESISFVFSSYYSDSPGSAFGHTFFRINRASELSQSKHELLDYGVGYAANVTVTNQAVYALYGLIGGFTGSWTNLPYYYKVREYNDFEARDLWSYDLDLKPEEVQMLTFHLWEVGPHFYTYYFFTQNCAFHMLTMLEAAAPRLNLIAHVPFYYVIPSDSMKALFFEDGLVKNVSFRPSIRKVFLERVKKLDLSTVEEFEVYAKTGVFSNSIAKVDEQHQALLLDAAIDLQDSRHPNSNNQNKNNLLQQRAKLDFISPEINVQAKPSDQPENSHGSSRIGLIFQEKSTVKSGLLEYRFALHDLLDPQAGLPQNSELEFFNFRFQFFADEMKLQDMNIFKVFNLNPINFFETKPSWGAELGLQNKLNYCANTDDTCFLTGALIKYGYSKNLFTENLILWSMATANLRYGATLLNSKYYTAPGFEFGLLYRLTENSALLAQFNREYPLERKNYDQNYKVQFRHTPSKNISFGLSIENDFNKLLAYYYF